MKKTAKQNFEDVISVLKILQVDNQEAKIFSNDTIFNKEFLYNYFYSKYMDEKKEKNESTEDIIKIAEKKAEETMLELINNNIIIPGTNGFELGKEVEHIKEVFFGVKKDAAIKSVLSSDETDLKQLFKLGVFKLSEEEIKSGKYEDVVDEKGFIKPSLKILNNDNDNPNIDLLNKIIGLNVNTGTRYYNGKDEYGCFEPGTVDENGNDISGYDVGGYDRYGFNKEGIHKATGQKYNEKYFIKTTDENGNTTFKNIYTDSDLDVFGYNIDGINPKTGFDNGLQQFNGKNAPQHFWHKYDERTGTPTVRDADKPPYEIPCDLIFMAIGQSIESEPFAKYGISSKMNFVTDNTTAIKEHPGVFAGGDCVTGPATAIMAIGTGKIAAINIDEYLGYHHEYHSNIEIPEAKQNMRSHFGRVQLTERSARERRINFEPVENGMSHEEAMQESGKCLRCDVFGSGKMEGGMV